VPLVYIYFCSFLNFHRVLVGRFFYISLYSRHNLPHHTGPSWKAPTLSPLFTVIVLLSDVVVAGVVIVVVDVGIDAIAVL
jgi:hypothetical protein